MAAFISSIDIGFFRLPRNSPFSSRTERVPLNGKSPLSFFTDAGRSLDLFFNVNCPSRTDYQRISLVDLKLD
jgi:hypothetical protein